MKLPEGVKVTVEGRTYKGAVSGNIPEAHLKVVQLAIEKNTKHPDPKKQTNKQANNEQANG